MIINFHRLFCFQLIARRVRELNIYSEIYPYNKDIEIDSNVKAIILSGSPFSVRDENAPAPLFDCLSLDIPVLAICYGAQFLAHSNNGVVSPSKIREYGRANLSSFNNSSALFKKVTSNSQVWMSHGDTITKLGSSGSKAETKFFIKLSPKFKYINMKLLCLSCN